jgi:thiol-disulfide isomerase/thioredoxin
MRSEIRWTVVVMVLAIAGVIALWPRDGRYEPPDSVGPMPQVVQQSGDRTAPVPDDAALATLRRQAALQSCPTPPPGAPAPSGPLAGITVPCLGEPGSVDLAAALAGRPALLNVWASWCPPCREEMPALAGYAAAPDAIPVIGIDVQDRPADALTLLADLDVGHPSVTDPHGALQRALQAPPILPVSYVLHPDGSVEMVTPPRWFRTPDEVRQAVERYLKR